MRKEYIAPKIAVVVLEDLCEGEITTCSVMKGGTGEKISQFDVVEEEHTKTDEEYSGLWGNTSKWGDD